jgi:hypothetical protein
MDQAALRGLLAFTGGEGYASQEEHLSGGAAQRSASRMIAEMHNGGGCLA